MLTAAIIVSAGIGAVEEAAVRRQQYLTALRYYVKFAPVYFLENSGYDLLGDAEFTAIAGVQLREIAAQENESCGKGYREFHAVDIWQESEKNPPARIVKITGRYLFANIEKLLAECRAAPDDLLLFDLYPRNGIAVTSLFSTSWSEYAKYLRGLYAQVNDRQGVWIEHLFYRELIARRANWRLFRHEPDVIGLSGSSGLEMRNSRVRMFLKQVSRSINRLFDARFLHFRGQRRSASKA